MSTNEMSTLCDTLPSREMSRFLGTVIAGPNLIVQQDTGTALWQFFTPQKPSQSGTKRGHWMLSTEYWKAERRVAYDTRTRRPVFSIITLMSWID
jgi:hypothetical protein